MCCFQTDTNPQDYRIHPAKGQRNEAKMNVEHSPIILSPLYAKRAQKPDEANPMSS
jgi:hypothetical protein